MVPAFVERQALVAGAVGRDGLVGQSGRLFVKQLLQKWSKEVHQPSLCHTKDERHVLLLKGTRPPHPALDSGLVGQSGRLFVKQLLQKWSKEVHQPSLYIYICISSTSSSDQRHILGHS